VSGGATSMTATEILDGLSDTLLSDERILSAQERALLANLLQRARTHASARDNTVTETIARIVGEITAQRAYGILGDSLAHRLIHEAALSSPNGEVPWERSQAEAIPQPLAHPPQPPGPVPPS